MTRRASERRADRTPDAPVETAPAARQQAFADAVIDGLARSGVTDMVLSPGSRSTPFVLAARAHPGLRCHVVIDERSAGFVALGMGRATGHPAALLCTSGTAPAHYYPAVIEASASFVPLVVLSADRPVCLHGVGANQTIDQQALFGAHVRAFVELGGAWDREPRDACRAVIAAVAASLGPTPGAVHLNARADKPLEPPPGWQHRVGQAAPRIHAPRPGQPSIDSVEDVTRACLMARRGLVVCGPAPLSARRDRDAVRALCEATGFPLLAEATSQQRLTGDPAGPRVDFFEPVLSCEAARQRLAPDLILQLGATPTSRGYELLITSRPDLRRIVVAEHGLYDPWSRAEAVVRACPGELAGDVAARLSGVPELRRTYRDAWAAADELVRRAAEAALGPERPLVEGAVVRAAVEALPPRGLVMLGSSLPVRAADLLCDGARGDVGVLHQRGASGIDGLVSGAAGAALAGDGPVALVVGDVSFLHDLTGLMAARSVATPFAVVVVNNGGGRIFEQLPLGGRVDLADALDYFVTPHVIDIEHAARLYGRPFARCRDAGSLGDALREALRRGGCSLIEAVVDPVAGRAVQGRLAEAVSAAFERRRR